MPAVRARTWVYRVAHHVAASHVIRERKIFSKLVSLEELEMLPDKDQGQFAADQRINLERLSTLIQRLKPLDRQVIISYLEDMDAASIGEITGLSPGNVAMRIHRIKNILARRFREGGSHADDSPENDPKNNLAKPANGAICNDIGQDSTEGAGTSRKDAQAVAGGLVRAACCCLLLRFRYEIFPIAATRAATAIRARARLEPRRAVFS